MCSKLPVLVGHKTNQSYMNIYIKNIFYFHIKQTGSKKKMPGKSDHVIIKFECVVNKEQTKQA